MFNCICIPKPPVKPKPLEDSVKYEKMFKAVKKMDDKINRQAYDMKALGDTLHLPKSIYCPISRMPMVDPVIAPDGNSYERCEILRWWKKKETSPITGAKLELLLLIPNHALRKTISEIIHHTETDNKSDNNETENPENNETENE